MGICQSIDEPPNCVVGSTVISGQSVMIIGDSALIPLRDNETNESAVIEVDLKNRNIKILRGVGGSLTHRFINSSRKKKKNDKMFIDVESDGEVRENNFTLN